MSHLLLHTIDAATRSAGRKRVRRQDVRAGWLLIGAVLLGLALLAGPL